MSKGNGTDGDVGPSDAAARAAWLYYIGGLTQDQIARELGVSRQRAQRLVSRAVEKGLIHVRLEHKVSGCLELEIALKKRFGLRLCRVALSLPKGSDPVVSIAPTAAVEMERFLSAADPIVMALGTGRTLRATVDELTTMECEHHKIVSLNGSIAPDGSASYYDVIMRITDKVRAAHFPMPLPVIAESIEEHAVLQSLKPVLRVSALARSADVTFVGVGQMSDDAPLLKDGFISKRELTEMQLMGAAGEIAGWIYDRSGRYLKGGTNARVAGVRVDISNDRLACGIAAGPEKLTALKAALGGNLLNGLVTDEATASALLK